MAGMRLGTRIAVIDDDRQILLSKRGDFGTWALPGGRLDPGETIAASAVREAREETGLIVEIERPVGLYFQQGRNRMNVLYRARPVGGQLLGATDETLDNRFFPPDALPEPRFGQFYIDHAYTDQTHLHTQVTPAWELMQLDLKLRWRWIQNLLAGRPEPRFPSFAVWAAAIIWEPSQQRVLSVWDEAFAGQDQRPSHAPSQRTVPTLPRVQSRGDCHLHASLSRHLQRYCTTPLDWRWSGLWHNTTVNVMEFVFEATVQPHPDYEHLWRKPSEIAGARGRNHAYLHRAAQQTDPATIWTIHADEPYFVLI